MTQPPHHSPLGADAQLPMGQKMQIPQTNRPRLPNWQTRWLTYYSYVKKNYSGLEWGEFDCTHWIGGAIEALTGVNPHEEFYGRYVFPEEAAALVREQGFANLGDMLIARGYKEVEPIHMQTGDIVEFPTDPRSAKHLPAEFAMSLGVADPPYVLGVGMTGIVKGPMSEVTRVFKVGGAANT